MVIEKLLKGRNMLEKETHTTQDKFLRRPEVCEMTSLPSSTLTDLIREGHFPKPYKPYTGARLSVWRLSEIINWMDTRPRIDES